MGSNYYYFKLLCIIAYYYTLLLLYINKVEHIFGELKALSIDLLIDYWMGVGYIIISHRGVQLSL